MSLIGESKRKIVLHIADVEEDHGYAIADSFDLQLPAVYEHLQNLEDEGILVSRKEGRRRVYELTEDGEKLAEILR